MNIVRAQSKAAVNKLINQCFQPATYSSPKHRINSHVGIKDFIDCRANYGKVILMTMFQSKRKFTRWLAHTLFHDFLGMWSKRKLSTIVVPPAFIHGMPDTSEWKMQRRSHCNGGGPMWWCQITVYIITKANLVVNYCVIFKYFC